MRHRKKPRHRQQRDYAALVREVEKVRWGAIGKPLRTETDGNVSGDNVEHATEIMEAAPLPYH